MAELCPAFVAMRESLVERGLLAAAGDAFRLTEAGNAHVAGLIAELQHSESLPDPELRGIRWNFGRERLA